jgi:hypothetical protein
MIFHRSIGRRKNMGVPARRRHERQCRIADSLKFQNAKIDPPQSIQRRNFGAAGGLYL